MTEPQALATGEIAETPLGGLLFSISEKQLTGSIVLAETPERLHCISFKNGYPCKVRPADSTDMTGEILVENGVFDANELQEILEYSGSSGVLTGLAAVQLGLAGQEDVEKALSQQILRRVARLFSLNTGTFGFYGNDFLAAFGGDDAPTVDPLKILAAGAREYYDVNRLTNLVKGLENRPLGVLANAEMLGRFGFEQPEAAVIATMSTKQPLSNLLLAAGQPPGVVYAVVHCLHMTGLLDMGENAGTTTAAPAAPIAPPVPEPAAPIAPPAPEPAAPIAPPAPEPAAPAERVAAPTPGPLPDMPDDEKSERRLEAERLIEKGEKANYYELLGVPPEASDKEIQRAYIGRAKQFHPDRATGDLTDLRPHLADLFARISAAHQILKDPTQRSAYLEELRAKQSGALEPRETEEDLVRKLLDADEGFFKANILMKRNRLDEAEELVRKAVEVNPEQGDYLALQTWIEARRRRRTEPVTDLIEILKKAVELAPASEQAHFYLAQLLHQDGQSKDALKSYERVMELNEHNIDAVRMVRMLKIKRQEMRAKKDRKGSSFLGSLFGGGKKK